MIQPNMPALETCGSLDWKRFGSQDGSALNENLTETQKYTANISFFGSGNECMGKCSFLFDCEKYNF